MKMVTTKQVKKKLIKLEKTAIKGTNFILDHITKFIPQPKMPTKFKRSKSGHDTLLTKFDNIDVALIEVVS